MGDKSLDEKELRDKIYSRFLIVAVFVATHLLIGLVGDLTYLFSVIAFYFILYAPTLIYIAWLSIEAIGDTVKVGGGDKKLKILAWLLFLYWVVVAIFLFNTTSLVVLAVCVFSTVYVVLSVVFFVRNGFRP